MSLTYTISNEHLADLIATLSKNNPENEKILTDFFDLNRQVKKKRGRPAKEKTLDAEDAAKKEDSGADAPAEVLPKKKRGRPSKKESPKVDDSIKNDSPEVKEPVKEDDPDAKEGELKIPAEEIPKKKKGRPAKKKEDSIDNNVKDDKDNKDDSDQKKDESHKKKRGRPSKKDASKDEAPIQKDISNDVAQENEIPKKKRATREEIDTEFWGDLNDRKFQTYNFEDEKSAKFWEFCQDGTKILIRYGKSGKTGALQQKSFKNTEDLSKFLSKETIAKEKKGYVMV